MVANATNSDITQPDLIATHLRQVTLRPKLLEIGDRTRRRAAVQLDWTTAPTRRRRELVVPNDASPTLRRMKSEEGMARLNYPELFGDTEARSDPLGAPGRRMRNGVAGLRARGR